MDGGGADDGVMITINRGRAGISQVRLGGPARGTWMAGAGGRAGAKYPGKIAIFAKNGIFTGGYKKRSCNARKYRKSCCFSQKMPFSKSDIKKQL